MAFKKLFEGPNLNKNTKKIEGLARKRGFLVIRGGCMTTTIPVNMSVAMTIRPWASNPEGNVSNAPYGCLANLVVVLNLLKGPQDSGPDSVGLGRLNV